MGSETGSYGQSGSSGGQLHSAKGLYESRKSYGRNVGTMGDVSEYRVEVSILLLLQYMYLIIQNILTLTL